MIFRFENCALDTDLRELRRGPDLVALEPQVFDLLVYLVQNRDRVVSKDDLIASVWGGRIVSDSTLDSRINAARKAVGDSGEQQRLIRTIARKGVRFISAVDGPAKPQPPPAASGSASPAPQAITPQPPASQPSAPPRPVQPPQEIHFCTASDGCRIAYAVAGQGPPLIKTANWLNHLEFDWQSPIWSHLLHALAADHRLVRYDARGNGLSDWEVEDISFDAFVRDLESVVEAAGPERFALLGISQGCAVSIAYAVRHPERVSHLILYGGYARGRCKRGSEQEIAQADALLTLMREGWGRENPAFRHVFTSLFIPGGTAEQTKWFDELQRVTTSPQNAVRIRAAMNHIDVSALLPQVKVPTLVLHCLGEAVVPFDEGRRLAAGIPGAHFVALDGQNHLVLESDPAWTRFLDEIKSFLKR